MKPARSIVLVISVLILVSLACNLPSFRSLEDGTIEATGSGLQPGSFIKGTDGVTVGATENAIEEAIDISIQREITTDHLAPFPDGIQAHGEYYRVFATTRAVTLPGESFLVGVPVPEGIEVEHLALAIHTPPDLIVGHGKQPAGPTWSFVDGFFDPDSRLLFGVVGALNQQGQVMAIAEHDSFVTRQTGNGQELGGLRNGNFLLRPARLQQGVEFEVICRPGFDLDNVPENCTQSDKEQTNQVLQQAYHDLNSYAYHSPNLYRKPRSLLNTAGSSPEITPGPYVFQLAPCSRNDAPGRYVLGPKKAWACLGTNGFTSGVADIIRHEYFHATQYAYSSVVQAQSRKGWWIEGQASTMQTSFTSLKRANLGVRNVDIEFTSDTGMYQAQDFWLYLAKSLNEGPDFLLPFLQNDPDAQSVNTVINNNYPQLGGLGAVYWEWVKNQSFEKAIDIGNGVLGDNCDLTTNSGGKFRAITNNPPPTRIDYTYAVSHPDFTMTLEPLSSKVIPIDLSALPEVSYRAQVDVETNDPFLMTKFYDSAHVGTTDCRPVPENRSHVIDINAGQDRTLYLLISNTSLEESGSATLSFTSAEGFTILAPDGGQTFEEGESVEFVGVVSGFEDQDDEFINIYWTYHAPDGSDFTFGQTENGEAVDFSSFCDGEYTVTARALNGRTSEEKTESVRFTVVDPEYRDPPSDCEPSIGVTAPRYHQKFDPDDDIFLEAEVSPAPGSNELRYPVIWTVDGEETEIARGLNARASAAGLEPGRHLIYVHYGSVSGFTAIIILEEDNGGPAVRIQNPQNKERIPFQDQDVTEVRLEGHALDPEDGRLTGDALKW